MARTRRHLTDKEQQKALNTFRLSRIVLPIMLGLGVVAFLFFRQFDASQFAQIKWTQTTLVWILLALGCLLMRILSYAYRLYILADRAFTFSKCIQLIFLWEFSSAVSPTNVGGSAVALFIISQEKIGAARTTTIVIYTIVLDALFFLIFIPVWVWIFGGNILGPGRLPFDRFGGWEITLLLAYALIFAYGFFFAFGLFYRPETLKRLSLWLSKRKILQRYRRQLVRLGEDITLTSRALFRKNFRYHLTAFLTTVSAWSFRFFLIICLIIGIAQTVTINLTSIFELYARIQTMFIVMAVSPTPGGAGFAEILFGSLLADYVPAGISPVISLIWRLMAYYSFLIAGVVIIPQWLSKVIKNKKARRQPSD